MLLGLHALDIRHPLMPVPCRCAGTYKIPTVNDIPLDLRVTLLRDAPCAQTPLVHSSKAVGEPPLFLGASVFFALKARCRCAHLAPPRAACLAARQSDVHPNKQGCGMQPGCHATRPRNKHEELRTCYASLWAFHASALLTSTRT